MVEGKNSRVEKSFKNFYNSIIAQICSVLLSFVVRTIFIKYLGNTYLGVNGLFSNILTIFSLAELGFGTAMVYNLYKPLALNDTNKIKTLINLYSKVYKFIGGFIAFIGIIILPYISFFVKDDNYDLNLKLIFMFFLLDSVLSYFYSYKRTILTADQKEYILLNYKNIFIVIKSILQIVMIVLFENFFFYLGIQICITVVENIYVSHKINELYPFLKEKQCDKISKDELKIIIEDIKALFLTKFGYVILDGTDNIIISSLLGLNWIGLLSNYLLLINTIKMFLSQIISSITGSVGNYMVTELNGDKYKLFKKIDLINFWGYGFSTLCLGILLNPFIFLWFGEGFMLNQNIINVLVLNFFIEGFLKFIWLFKSTMGIFTKGKYRPIITAILNIIFSIVLANKYGLIGVLLGTTFSKCLVNIWYEPYVLFKYGFNEKIKGFYITYLFRISILIITFIILNRIQLNLNLIVTPFFCFVLMGIISFCVINAIFTILFFKQEEFKYILETAIKILNFKIIKSKDVSF